jgi:hypothetical protein
MDDDLFHDITRRLERAKRARPDIPEGDMLFSILGDEHVETIDEHNAAGEPTIFACLRTATADPGCVVRGSTRVACQRCGAEVWISPATRATRDRITKAETVCLDCLGLLHDAGGT